MGLDEMFQTIEDEYTIRGRDAKVSVFVGYGTDDDALSGSQLKAYANFYESRGIDHKCYNMADMIHATLTYNHFQELKNVVGIGFIELESTKDKS